MKVIPKFQEGGFMSLFTSYTPVQTQAPSQQQATRSSTSKEEDSTKGQLTEKDLFEMISKIDGLPNDMKNIVDSLRGVFEMQSLTGNGISSLSSTYLSSLYQIKTAGYNKKEYDNAYKEVVKNGGLNEQAITESGQLIVMDKETENIKQISVKELLNSNDKYVPLTNSNLLYLRAWSPEYANKNQILETVSNGIGIAQVDRMIREKLTGLGTSETVRSGYSVKSDNYIAQGLNVLSKMESAAVAGETGMTLDGMYRNKLITKEQKQQAQAALQYIYNTLPENAKTLLQIKSQNASNPIGGALDVISQIISSRMSSTNSSETEWVGTLEQVLKSPGKGGSSKSGGSGSGDDDFSDDIKSSPYYNMSKMIGGTTMQVTINKGSKYEMETSGVHYASIPDINNKPIGKTSLQGALESGLQGVVTDTKAITFGDVVLDSSDFSNIMFDGNGGGTIAILPAKMSQSGAKIVDLDALDRWQAANEELNKRGITSVLDEARQQEIVQVLYNHDLDGLIDLGKGTIDRDALGQFMIVDGYAVSQSGNDKFKDSGFVSQIDDDGREIPIIEQALSTDDKKSNYKIDANEFYDWNGHDNVYAGCIYIPITNNQLAALTASGQNVNEGPAMQKELEYQMWQKQIQAKEPKFGLLYEGK